MSLPEAALLNLVIERGDGNQSVVIRLKGDGLPVRAFGRQWRMEFWDEDRTELFCDAAATPQLSDDNVVTLEFGEVELAYLPSTFWGDLLVVLENGRRRYLLQVRGTSTGVAYLIEDILIAVGDPQMPAESTPLIGRALVTGSAAGRTGVLYTPLPETTSRLDRALVSAALTLNRTSVIYTPP